jgi:excinuclease UvrABC nuclease subunit
VLASFLTQFYEEVPPPKAILLDRELRSASCSRSASRARRAQGALKVPQRGDQASMIRHAKRNAEEALDRRLAETSTQHQNLRALAETVRAAKARRSGSKSMTTATSWAPARRRDDRRRARRASVRTAIASSTSSARRPRPATISR